MTTFTIEQAIKTLELTIEYLRREGNSIEREISICSLTNKIISYHEKVQSVPLDEEEVSELDEEENTSDDSPAKEVKIPKKRGRPPKKVVEDENTSDDSYVKEENTSDEQETDVEEKKPRKPRVLKEPIDLSSYGDLESLDWNRFVLNEGNHNKFWRGTLRVQEFEGTPVFRVLVHYGKIDSKGIFVQKTFESEDLSKKFMDNEIKSKNKKGYVRD